MTTITGVVARDLRFQTTSLDLSGSDAICATTHIALIEISHYTPMYE